MTDKVMNPQPFAGDPADVRIWIRFNLESWSWIQDHLWNVCVCVVPVAVTQILAEAAQYVSLPLPGRLTTLPAELGWGCLDRCRHCHFPPIYQPCDRYY